MGKGETRAPVLLLVTWSTQRVHSEEEQERNSLKPFLHPLLLAFRASLGIALLTEEKEGDTLKEVIYKGSFLEIKCVEPGEGKIEIILQNLDQRMLTWQTPLPSRD